MAALRHDAVVLAGGKGSRLGGISKPELEIGGRQLLDRALAAASGSVRTVVVGDVPVPAGVLRTREDPPYGGPVAGLEAGCALLDATATAAAPRSPWTLVLASDLPDAEAAAAVLLAADPRGHDGACLLDADGRLQWVLGIYRSDLLGGLLAGRGGITALWRLLAPLNLLGVPGGAASTADIDTPEDLAAWTDRLR